MSYYPFGMSSSSIPGFDAVDRVVSYQCENDDPVCDFDGEVEATVERGVARFECPTCGIDCEQYVLDE